MQGQTLSSGEHVECVVVGDPAICGKQAHYLLVTAEALIACLRVASFVCVWFVVR